MLAVAVTVVLSRFKLPTVAGLLAAGALLGPFGLGLARSVHAIEVLAEVGVVLLLFSIGLEFSLARLRDIFRQVALGGALQVGLTTAVAAGVAMALGQPARRGRLLRLRLRALEHGHRAARARRSAASSTLRTVASSSAR